MKYMHGMTNSEKLFSDEFIDQLLEGRLIQYQCQMSIYYNYSPDGKKLLFYIMLTIVSIGIHMKLLKNGMWTL